MPHFGTFSGKCRYIVTDIDFTFIDNAKNLIPENVEAVRMAQEAGIQVAFATGRYWKCIKDWVEQLGMTGPQITDNGASVFSPATGEVVRHAGFDERLFRFFYKGLRNAGYSVIVGLPHEYYCTELVDETRRGLEEHNESVVQLASDEELMSLYATSAGKMTAFVDKKAENLERLERVARDLCRKAREVGLDFCEGYTEPGIWVVMPAGINKLAGVKMALETMDGCTLDDVAAIGDGDNDADMLAGCGLGFAMANASELARESASTVVSSNEQAGFAQAVRMILEQS